MLLLRLVKVSLLMLLQLMKVLLLLWFLLFIESMLYGVNARVLAAAAAIVAAHIAAASLPDNVDVTVFDTLTVPAIVSLAVDAAGWWCSSSCFWCCSLCLSSSCCCSN